MDRFVLVICKIFDINCLNIIHGIREIVYFYTESRRENVLDVS